MREVTEDFILDFGKYKGKTIAEVRKVDNQYIKWATFKGIFKISIVAVDKMFRELLDEVFKGVKDGQNQKN